MKKLTDVHTEHCCAIHGCKYGDDDDCTVMIAAKNKVYIQSFPCETCWNNGHETLESALRTIHPTMGTFANHIILYAKHWYGSSYNGEEDQSEHVLNDLRKLQARFYGLEEEHVRNNDVRASILEVFLKYAKPHDQREGLKEAFGWYWGRDNTVVNDRAAETVMISKLGIVDGEYAYLPELYPDICFDRDKGKKCEECDKAKIPATAWNHCRVIHSKVEETA